MRDIDALAFGNLPNGLAGTGGNDTTIEGEEQLVCHGLIALLFVGELVQTSTDPVGGPHLSEPAHARNAPWR